MAEDLTHLWHKAAATEWGIALKTDDRDLLKQRLYACRPEEYKGTIAIALAQDKTELWLCKKPNIQLQMES